MSEAGYEGVAVVAPATVPHVRHSDLPAQGWLAAALRATLAEAGIAKDAVDGLTVSSFTLAPDSAIAMTAHLGLSPRFLADIPLGGASGVVALRRAARAVQAGEAEIVACLAGDTHAPGSFRALLARFSRFAQDATLPYGGGGPNALFALIAEAWMAERGATRADTGRLAVAQRANAGRNPRAFFRAPLTLEAYLAARPIAPPIHLYDCVMPCAGAEAFLVMAEDRARALGLPLARLRAACERHNAFAEDPVQRRGGWAAEAPAMWDRAGLGPGDMDLVQTYDDYPVICLMQLEDLGFCPPGGAPALVRDRDLTRDGDLPHNVAGGQLNCGQAGAAGGFHGLVEAVRQVTGRAGPTQVAGARRACVSGFGMIVYDRGLCAAAAVLEGAP